MDSRNLRGNISLALFGFRIKLIRFATSFREIVNNLYVVKDQAVRKKRIEIRERNL